MKPVMIFVMLFPLFAACLALIATNTVSSGTWRGLGEAVVGYYVFCFVPAGVMGFVDWLLKRRPIRVVLAAALGALTGYVLGGIAFPDLLRPIAIGAIAAAACSWLSSERAA
jgi:hypothetical protein